MSSDSLLSWTAKMKEDTQTVVSIELCYADGECLQKNISFDDFRRVINEAAQLSEKMRIGRLPHGYYDACMDVQDPTTFTVVVVVPKGLRTVSYYDTAYDIPYPATVFRFQVENGRLNSSNAFFIKNALPSDEEHLFQYCFGNVVSNSGHICWGSNHLPDLSSMKAVDRLVALFFGSPCNDDYYSYGRFASGAPEYCQTQRALYEHLKGCTEFPFEILAETNRTLGDLLT